MDPAAFLAMAQSRLLLPGPDDVDMPATCDRMVVDMRRGWHRSEFGMYRYDVVFRRAARVGPAR